VHTDSILPCILAGPTDWTRIGTVGSENPARMQQGALLRGSALPGRWTADGDAALAVATASCGSGNRMLGPLWQAMLCVCHHVRRWGNRVPGRQRGQQSSDTAGEQVFLTCRSHMVLQA
jgi:hypothetical protein